MPKVFISYSWTTPAHQTKVKELADQLIVDGVEVLLDIYDLNEGDDKYSFMERMVTDPSVSHVLLICDKGYAEKADARKSGVGTESQIISKEVYKKVKQSKFIPVVCEVDEKGNPFLPTFLESRIWIDFSTPETANENWEQLIRVLYGKPLHQKPNLGKPPTYLSDDSASPSSPAISKYNTFKQAVLQGKPGIPLYRKDFLSACVDFADQLRVRERPNVDSLGQKVLEDCFRLIPVRDHIVDWVLLETTMPLQTDFSEELHRFMEQLLELKSRPAEMRSWNESWFEAHSLFAYETFLYIVAALMKTNAYSILHEIFNTHYLCPESERTSQYSFDNFSCFFTFSRTLQEVLGSPGRRLLSPAAALVKRQANRSDLPFSSIIEAELLTILMMLLNSEARWYPGTLLYSPNGATFSFFLRATQHKGYRNMAVITGINDANDLRLAVKKGIEQRGSVLQDIEFHMRTGGLWQMLNMDQLDTLA